MVTRFQGLIVALALLSTLCEASPHKLLGIGEVERCANDAKECHLRGIEGLGDAKSSWKLNIKKRLSHTRAILEHSREIGEATLIKGDMLLANEPYHPLGQLYHMYGSNILERYEHYSSDRTFLMLGSHSPLINKLERYQEIVQALEVEPVEKRKVLMQKWVKSEQLHEVLKLSHRLESLFDQTKSVSEQVQSFVKIEGILSSLLEINNCPELVKSRLEEKIGPFEISLDNAGEAGFKNEKKIRMFISPAHTSEALKVTCKKQTSDELSSELDLKSNHLKLQYHQKNGRVIVSWPLILDQL